MTFKLDEKGNSNLKFIGTYAFNDCDLTYTVPTKPLEIPSSVTTIETKAFNSSVNGTDTEPKNRNLNYIRFNGTLTEVSDWYSSDFESGVTERVP